MLEVAAVLGRVGVQQLMALNDRLVKMGYPPLWLGWEFNPEYRTANKPRFRIWPLGQVSEVYLYWIPSVPPQNSGLRWVPAGEEPQRDKHEITIKL